MKLNPKNLQILSSVTRVAGIRNNRSSPLILIKPNGEIYYAKNVGEKDNLLTQFDPKEDALLYSWSGQYSTDVFVVTEDDLKKHY